MPDPGVLVSAAINSQGNPYRILRAWRDGEVNLVVCPHLIEELREVLGRPRMRRYVSAAEAEAFIDALTAAADVRADPDPVTGLVPEDPDDDYLVALARETGVDYVLASDQHLLNLKAPRPRIITPAALAAELESRRAE